MLDRIGDQWSLLVLQALAARLMRFGEINRAIGDISKQMLSRTLKRLEQDGFVKRTLFAEIPPRVAFESPYRQFRTRARARRVVPISELVFRALTQDRSSLEDRTTTRRRRRFRHKKSRQTL